MSNVVPVAKKIGNLRVCIDFTYLNAATKKDEYPMTRMMSPKRHLGAQVHYAHMNGWQCPLASKTLEPHISEL